MHTLEEIAMFNIKNVMQKLKIAKRSTKKTLDLIYQVDEILKAFDGKVINKKFSNELQGLHPNIMAGRPYMNETLTISLSGQRINNNILSSKCLTTENGKTYRLDYSLAHSALMVNKEFLEKDLEKIYFSINNYEEVVREIKALKQSLHWTVQEYL